MQQWQNETTYFDANGNPDDCYPQAFPQMSLSVGGFILLGIGLFWLLCMWGMCWAIPRICNLNYVLRGIGYNDVLLPATMQSAHSDACLTTAKGNKMQGAGMLYSERSLAMINT